MKSKNYIPIIFAFAIIFTGCGSTSLGDSSQNLEGKLPAPKLKGHVSIEETLNQRQSIRQFQDKPLSIEQVSQLLWAAQGITHSWGERKFRTAPSAGATYPFELYVFTSSGGYKYNTVEHSLSRAFDDDLRKAISEASLGQTAVSDAHAVFVLTMIEERTSQRYGDRAYRYICMEAGHIAQNIHLMAVALGLGSVPVGAFNDEEVAKILSIDEGEVPLYIIPVGFPLEEE
jgi:SagB-type dehydrogenase family enzyme